MPLMISLISLGISALLLAVIGLKSAIEKRRLSPAQRELRKSRQAASQSRRQSRFYQKLYQYYARIPIIRGFVVGLRQNLTLIGENSKPYLNRKIAIIVSRLLVLYLILIGFFYYLTGNVLYTAIFVFFLWYVADSYFDYYVGKSHERLLSQLIQFISSVRQKYYEFNIVDDAIYEAVQDLEAKDREIAVQGERIYELLMDSNRELALARYMAVAPNSYLKMLANIANMTMEYGDQITDGQSVFLINLSFLKKNIELEVEKRRKLNYALKSMNLIAMIPLLLLSVVKNWALANFPPLSVFYESSIGKYTEIGTILIILISMVLLNKIQKLDYGNAVESRLDRLLSKLRVPIDKKRKKKWLLAGVGFLFSLSVVLSIEAGSKQALRYKVHYSDDFLGGSLDKDSLQTKRAESMADYEFVKAGSENISDQQIVEYLATVMDDKVLDQRVDSDGKVMNHPKVTQRIAEIREKIRLYHQAYVRWWQLLICFFIGIISYFIPDINRLLEQKLREMDIDDEVAGFRSIIMMLMYNPRMNVETIIEWLYDYSNYYSEPLHRCSLNISAGEIEALEQLKDSVNHEPLRQIIRQLIMASRGITIEQAFDELIQEKANFFELRRWQNQKIISRKILLGQNIGFLPAYGLIILYMIVPMIVTSAQELDKFYRKLF